MAGYVLITNNPLLTEAFPQIEITECRTVSQTLITTRDLVHRGYRLVTHPLAGSLKPNETPYRSIILEKGTKLHERSLWYLEQALQKYAQFPQTPPLSDYPADALSEYQILDRSLMESAIHSLAIQNSEGNPISDDSSD